MKIELFTQSPDGSPWVFFFLWLIVWLGVLYRILIRHDFDSSTKLLWVVVVIFVPFFGMLLYAIAAPDGSKQQESSNPVIPGSDVSGTPWAVNPGHTTRKTYC